MMPGMNGFEVIRKMKEAEIETPIIVLSAISQREAVLKVLQAGVKSYMIKPLKPEAIIKKSIEVLQAAI
jgi:DNA-binding response OmpR family regulator